MAPSVRCDLFVRVHTAAELAGFILQMGVIPSDDPEQSERFCQLRIMYRWGAAHSHCTCAAVCATLLDQYPTSAPCVLFAATGSSAGCSGTPHSSSLIKCSVRVAKRVTPDMALVPFHGRPDADAGAQNGAGADGI